MKKTKIKFILSILFLFNAIIIALFYQDKSDFFEKYLLPIFFIYFLVDAIVVLLPYFNKSVYSSKHYEKNFLRKTPKDTISFKSKIRKNNIKAILVFFLYFGALGILGILYHRYDSFNKIHIYVLFFAANFADYFCILIWCPFRSLIFKNKCCNQCRISNWDRIMKSFILIFIPNIYTITIISLGVLIFIVWEIAHLKHPERFYLASNDYLSCNNCNFHQCKKKKE